MYNLLVVLFVIVCVFLIFVVLLQPGRGGMGGAFGAGMSQQVFGGAGPTNILQKITAISAALFMVLSVALAYMSSSHGGDLDSAIENVQGRRPNTSMSSSAMSAGTTAPATAPAESSSSSSSSDMN